MRIRRSLTTTASSSAVATSSDPDHDSNNLFTAPRRCSNTTVAKTSIIVCVFNQSPWDVADLSSVQLDGGIFSLTGTGPVPELAIGSQSFVSSVNLCGAVVKLSAAFDKCSDRKENINSGGFGQSKVKIRAEKSSTGGVVVATNKPQIRSVSVKKQQKDKGDSTPKAEIKRIAKPSVNPDEFYYYSGFGPHWSKKRETVTKPIVVANKTVVSDQELRNGGNNKRDIEFLEYEDDDDDDEEVNEEGTRRPGGRKRVKARSLKSLM